MEPSGLRERSRVETCRPFVKHRRREKISVSLLGKVDREVSRVLITTIHSIVLDNLANRFLKPNILDIKLGTRLYDDEASEEKKARMIKTAAATTSFTTGIRLTGFQVSQYVMIGISRILLRYFRLLFFYYRFMTRRPGRRSTRPRRTANRSKRRICQTALPSSSQFIRNS